LRIVIGLVLLFPTLLIAQNTFGPTRIDDGLDSAHFYPSLFAREVEEVWCTWASVSATRLASFGQRLGSDGEFLGARETFESRVPGQGQVTCPGALQIVPLAGGGEARLLQHS
jgi:hypothetical protein